MIPGQTTCNLWWAKWQWDRFYSKYSSYFSHHHSANFLYLCFILLLLTVHNLKHCCHHYIKSTPTQLGIFTVLQYQYISILCCLFAITCHIHKPQTFIALVPVFECTSLVLTEVMTSSQTFFVWHVLAKTITADYNYVQVEVFHKTFLKEVYKKDTSFKQFKIVC